MKVSLRRKIHIMALPQGTFLNARWSEDQSATMPCKPSGGASTAGFVIASCAMRRDGADWRSLAPPMALWFNTAMLIVGSVFFQRARSAAKSGQIDGVKLGLLAGGVCTLVFLAGQLWAWQQLNADGYFLTTNPANSFFYLLTALHGLHLLGGLWVWAKTTVKVHHGAAVHEVRLSVELCTVYWHFLLVVWLVLFGLLLFT